jgi:hypothetical protein
MPLSGLIARLRRLFTRKQAEAPQPDDDAMADTIRRDVAAAFTPPDEIVRAAVECDESDDPDEVVEARAESLLSDAVRRHLAEEAKWPAVTDCDRLDAAFAELEKEGVVCRQNFSCCGTCAVGEIIDVMQEESAQGRDVIGCAHYNCQTTESAVEGQGIHLSYGAICGGDTESVAIGHRIARAVAAHGLTVTWDGDLTKRIHVALDWKRRLPPELRSWA